MKCCLLIRCQTEKALKQERHFEASGAAFYSGIPLSRQEALSSQTVFLYSYLLSCEWLPSRLSRRVCANIVPHITPPFTNIGPVPPVEVSPEPLK